MDRYVPSAWGYEFHALPYDEVLGAGSAGPGKTWVLTMDPFTQIGIENERQQPWYKGKHSLGRGESIGHALLLRRTFPRVEMIINRSKVAFPKVDPGAKYYESNKLWVFSCGYKYQFGHCSESGDWENYTGLEYTWLGFDELVEFEEEQYDQISMRLRTGDPVLVHLLRTRSTSNPLMTQSQGDRVSVKNPHWVRDRFVKPARRGRVVLKRPIYNQDGTLRKYNTLFYLPATIDDNPDPVVREAYKTRLLGAKPHIRRALLDGDWFITAGSYHGDEWNQQLHVVRPFGIPDDWRLFRSMDWGFKKPGCIHWWAIDQDDSMHCVRELWFQGLLASEVAKHVRDIESGRQLNCWDHVSGRSTITGPADNQLWEERGDRVKSKAEDFEEAGVSWVRADKHSRRRNSEELSRRLKDHGHGTATPGIVFFETCRHAIETVPQVQTSMLDPESPADGGEDHAYDSILYACSYASRKGVGVSRIEKADSDEDDNRKLERPPRGVRGSWGYG